VKKITLFALVILSVIATSNVFGQYYYGSDGPVALSIDSNKVLIKFDSSFPPDSQKTLLDSIDRIVDVIEDDNVIDDFVSCSLSTGARYNSFADSLGALDGIYLIEPYYMIDDIPVPVGETFIVAFDVSLSRDEIDNINSGYGVVIDRLLYGFESIYLLKNTDSSGIHILDLANLYHEMEETHFAHPDFGIRFERYSYKLYDYYADYQDNIKKVIGEFNEKSVWDFAGLTDTIIVAVIDDGVESHEDLPPVRVLPGYDFSGPWDADPRPGPLESHGMACAGIIAASHTTNSAYDTIWSPWNGIISLNPHVKVMPIKIFGDDGSAVSIYEVAEAFDYAYDHGVDVTSNSYGWAVALSYPVLDTAILNIYRNGRNGLGTPIIFASGNSAESYPGNVAYPARLPYCLAIGATRLEWWLSDRRWYYSQYGSYLDLVAPSGDVCGQGDIWSLDQMQEFGSNPYVEEMCGMPVSWNCPMFQTNDWDYDCHFGGTSAACPIVAGIASLLIARNPNLTVDEIYDILKFSAVTELDWGTITPPDYEYGYGRVDAFRAMLAICHGDANNDGNVNIGDGVHINNYIFKDGPAPQPDVLTGDANCDGTVNTGDVCYIVNYIFHGGPAPQICFEY
jgi:subtilisin family serine protease